jgi:hypothetical protein
MLIIVTSPCTALKSYEQPPKSLPHIGEQHVDQAAPYKREVAWPLIASLTRSSGVTMMERLMSLTDGQPTRAMASSSSSRSMVSTFLTPASPLLASPYTTGRPIWQRTTVNDSFKNQYLYNGQSGPELLRPVQAVALNWWTTGQRWWVKAASNPEFLKVRKGKKRAAGD